MQRETWCKRRARESSNPGAMDLFKFIAKQAATVQDVLAREPACVVQPCASPKACVQESREPVSEWEQQTSRFCGDSARSRACRPDTSSPHTPHRCHTEGTEACGHSHLHESNANRESLCEGWGLNNQGKKALCKNAERSVFDWPPSCSLNFPKKVFFLF